MQVVETQDLVSNRGSWSQSYCLMSCDRVQSAEEQLVNQIQVKAKLKLQRTKCLVQRLRALSPTLLDIRQNMWRTQSLLDVTQLLLVVFQGREQLHQSKRGISEGDVDQILLASSFSARDIAVEQLCESALQFCIEVFNRVRSGGESAPGQQRLVSSNGITQIQDVCDGRVGIRVYRCGVRVWRCQGLCYGLESFALVYKFG